MLVLVMCVSCDNRHFIIIDGTYITVLTSKTNKEGCTNSYEKKRQPSEYSISPNLYYLLLDTGNNMRTLHQPLQPQL